MTRVVLAAAHLDSNPTNNRLKNLRALCQRCHMLHDRPQHLAQRWITYRRRSAVGDLFLGSYPALIAALTSKRTVARVAIRGRVASPVPSRRLAFKKSRCANLLLFQAMRRFCARSDPAHRPSVLARRGARPASMTGGKAVFGQRLP